MENIQLWWKKDSVYLKNLTYWHKWRFFYFSHKFGFFFLLESRDGLITSLHLCKLKEQTYAACNFFFSLMDFVELSFKTVLQIKTITKVPISVLKV